MEQTVQAISRLPRWALVAIGTALVVVLAILDYVTGPEVAFSIFYLIPIAIVSWFGNRRTGLLLCAVSAIAWMCVDLSLATYSHVAIHYWNSLVRFGFFVTVSMLLCEIVAARRRQEELVQFVVNDLRAPLRNLLLGLDVLEHEAGPSMPAGEREIVNIARSSGRRMLSLIQCLVDAVRFETRAMVLEPRPAEVEEIVGAAFDQVNLWAWNRGIRLKHEITPGVGQVFADPDVTIRVVVNLLARMVEGDPPASAITLHVEPAGAKGVSFRLTSDAVDVSRAAIAGPGGHVAAPPPGVAHATTDTGLRFCREAVEAQCGAIRLAFERGDVGFTLPDAAP